MIRSEYSYEDMYKSHERELEKIGTERYNQGIAEGEAKGEAKGHSKEKVETVKRMKSAGCSISMICMATNLSQDEVINIKN